MKKIGIILLVLVLLALTAGMIFSVVKITSNETTKSVTALNFKVGGLDEEGDFDKTMKSSIVTRDFLPLEGLSIEVAEDSDNSYEVFYYTKKGVFISADEAASETYAPESTLEGATQVKIVIHTKDGDALSFFDISKVLKPITIKTPKVRG